jgi:hypothetical protein
LVHVSELENFLYGNTTVFTTSSSNVQAMQYDGDRQLLLIWFKGGGKSNRRYTYRGVDEQKARRFYLAASRGRWTWEEIRWPGILPQSGPIISPP